MGWNIQLYISPLSVKFPEKEDQPEGGAPASGYHQDSGRPKLEMQWDHALAGEFENEQVRFFPLFFCDFQSEKSFFVQFNQK